MSQRKSRVEEIRGRVHEVRNLAHGMALRAYAIRSTDGVEATASASARKIEQDAKRLDEALALIGAWARTRDDQGE